MKPTIKVIKYYEETQNVAHSGFVNKKIVFVLELYFFLLSSPNYFSELSCLDNLCHSAAACSINPNVSLSPPLTHADIQWALMDIILQSPLTVHSTDGKDHVLFGSD